MLFNKRLRKKQISIHALREEGDRLQSYPARRSNISIHALREEGDLGLPAPYCCMSHFYPRPPRGGRPVDRHASSCFVHISIHALREEGDFQCSQSKRLGTKFLSTPSARRATWHSTKKPTLQKNFYPRPPRGGRLQRVINFVQLFEFLSTPSARRATRSFELSVKFSDISIHALREEGDASSSMVQM